MLAFSHSLSAASDPLPAVSFPAELWGSPAPGWLAAATPRGQTHYECGLPPLLLLPRSARPPSAPPPHPRACAPRPNQSDQHLSPNLLPPPRRPAVCTIVFARRLPSLTRNPWKLPRNGGWSADFQFFHNTIIFAGLEKTQVLLEYLQADKIQVFQTK